MALSLRRLAVSAAMEHTTTFTVSELSRSVAFYEGALGMKVLHRDDKAGGSALLGFRETSMSGIELQQAAEGTPLVKGDAFVGLGVTAVDALAHIRRSEQFGGKIVVPFETYGYGASIFPDEDEMVINPVLYGCVEDPDGHTIEIAEGVRNEPLRKVIINVLDLDETVAFYTDKVGMTLHRRRSNINSKPKHASICSFVSFAKTEDEGTMLELVYNYATERLNMGTSFVQIAVKGRLDSPSGQVSDPNSYQLLIL